MPRLFPNFVALDRKAFRCLSVFPLAWRSARLTTVFVYSFLVYFMFVNLFSFVSIIAFSLGAYGLCKGRGDYLRRANIIITVGIATNTILVLICTYLYVLSIFLFTWFESSFSTALRDGNGVLIRLVRQVLESLDFIDLATNDPSWYSYVFGLCILLSWIHLLIIQILPGWLGMSMIETKAVHLISNESNML